MQINSSFIFQKNFICFICFIHASIRLEIYHNNSSKSKSISSLIFPTTFSGALRVSELLEIDFLIHFFLLIS